MALTKKDEHKYWAEKELIDGLCRKYRTSAENIELNTLWASVRGYELTFYAETEEARKIICEGFGWRDYGPTWDAIPETVDGKYRLQHRR